MAKIKAETLLRKIQKGNASFNKDENPGYKKPGFSFGTSYNSISLFKKREIVQPYLHPIDSRLINTEIEKIVKKDLQTIDPKIAENYSKLMPTHLVNDLYSLYYNSSNKMKFEGLDKTNKIKFDILDSINNSLIKIVSNNSHLGSFVYTQEIGKFLYKKFMEMPPEQQEQLKKAMNGCNQGGDDNSKPKSGNGNQPKPGNGQPDPNKPKEQGPGSGKGQPSDKDPDEEGVKPPDEDQDEFQNNDTDPDAKSNRDGDNQTRGAANNGKGNSEKDLSQDAADQMNEDLQNMVDNLNSKESQKQLDQAFKEAEKTLDKLRDLGVDIENDEEMPEVERQEIVRNLNNLDGIRRSLQSLNTSKEKIMKAVKKMLNGTTNFFSQKCVQTDVELFEADMLLDINGIELLHPFFKKSRLFDLTITERKYIGKYDLYVDCSGSMSAGCGGDLGSVPRIDLAKSLAMQMKQLGILGDLYEFEGSPKKIMNTDMSILMMAARGGTDIENVLKNILKTGNNSVVLSDGESNVSSYTDKAFFIGIGTDFHYFKQYGGVGQRFVQENQCVHYDGKEFIQTEMIKR